MARIAIDSSEKEQQALENRAANLPYVRRWIESAIIQCFNVKKGNDRYSLNAFLSPDGKVAWMEFRSTGPIPNLSCPVGLQLDPDKFRKALDSEWAHFLKQVAIHMERVNTNG